MSNNLFNLTIQSSLFSIDVSDSANLVVLQPKIFDHRGARLSKL